MDKQANIVEQVRSALADNRKLEIHGGRSKAFYGYLRRGEPLDISEHSGVVDYDPGELIITCRAGSRLEDIRTLLAENGQYLPFEPPAFGDSATIGGTVACGFSGPRRPWSGSLRDYLLGVKLINGAGQVVSFGGQVMKNVAGYDISRMIAGSLGTLGVILEVSFKVLPQPASELTLSFECEESEAIQHINRWCGQALPLSAASWQNDLLHVRLSGAASETARGAGRLRADSSVEHTDHWQELREHHLEFFRGDGDVWRLSLPPAAGTLNLEGDCLVDWGGAQRWYRGVGPVQSYREAAEGHGGHATLFRTASDTFPFHPLPPLMQQLQTRIKQAMDPKTLFNPQRMNPDW